MCLGDIDGDGKNDLIVGSNNGNLYAWHLDGTPLTYWPVTLTGGCNVSPALADLDDDMVPEVIVTTSDNKLYVIEGNGTTWPPPYPLIGPSAFQAPAVADIDNDWISEIVVGCGDSVYAYNSEDGSLVTGWPVATGGAVNAVALAEIDGDGALEAIIGSTDYQVWCWDLGPGSYNRYMIPWPYEGKNSRNRRIYTQEAEQVIIFDLIPFQTKVPRGGTLDFQIRYFNSSVQQETADIHINGFLPGQINPIYQQYGALSFQPGLTVRNYSLTVPPIAPIAEEYRIEVELYYPEGGDLSFSQWMGFDVLKQMTDIP